ncbi:MAG: peptidoglycan-binding domain-containing protein [Planctomycetota bacterium]|jgi:peptidoglycan hydrolase-like protein with peptidoglycan-binding domain
MGAIGSTPGGISQPSSTSVPTDTLTSGLLAGQPALAGVMAGTETLARGSRGDGVRLMQQALISLGYDLGRWGADGDFGPTTERVLTQFQSDQGITANGRLDRNALVTLDAALDTGTGGTQLTSDLLAGQTALDPILAGASTLGRGSRGEAVRLAQQGLMDLGYDLGSWGADGDFGRTTEGVVSQFQRDQGLSATGRIDSNTLVSIDTALGGAVGLQSGHFKDDPTLTRVAEGAATLARGSGGEPVKRVQQALIQSGYDLGRWGADGDFGGTTERVIAQFQGDKGLPRTGVIDKRTMLALDSTMPATRNDIVFLGMGDHAIYEVRDLEKRSDIVGITDNPAGDDQVTLTIDGAEQTFDLTTDAGIDAFVATLGVTGARAAEIGGLIRSAGSDTRDETALLVKAFHEAESGERTIERLVLSGHSVGTGVWGDHNGMFRLSLLEDVMTAFPTAAAQVQDFMIAGCYSNSERHVEQFRDMMPNLKSIWAYGDSAPGSWTGAMIHNAIWEEASRGDNPGDVERSAASGTRKGEYVATWNIDDGFQGIAPQRPLAELQADIQSGQATYDSYFDGTEEVLDTQDGPLRDHYRLIQATLGHPDLPAGERAGLETQRDTTIRLIYFTATIGGRFQDTHGTAVSAGYQALGLPAPDFSSLTRKQALTEIAGFETALASANPKPAAATEVLALLTDGLRDLSTEHVPNTWV